MFDERAIAGDFSEAAARYAQHARLQAEVGAKLIAYAAPYVPPESLLLDVGAGSGEVSGMWPARVVALDLAEAMCRQARAKKIPSVCANALALPVKDGGVQVVASNVMLQWLGAPGNFFEEANRVLGMGGMLAVSTFAHGTLGELTDAFARAGEKHRVSDFLPPDALVAAIERSGFDMVVQQTETYTEHYDDLLDVCQYLRDIGAGNKRLNRPRGMLTLRKLREVAACYPRSDRGLPVSWVVQYMVARKT